MRAGLMGCGVMAMTLMLVTSTAKGQTRPLDVLPQAPPKATASGTLTAIQPTTVNPTQPTPGSTDAKAVLTPQEIKPHVATPTALGATPGGSPTGNEAVPAAAQSSPWGKLSATNWPSGKPTSDLWRATPAPRQWDSKPERRSDDLKYEWK